MKNIHLLPTDKPSRLFLKENTLLLNNQYTLQEVFPKGKCQNIYITSYSEEIKEGNWIITKGKLVQLSCMSYDMVKGSKVILTTDQDLIKDGVQAIDDEFLEWFVKNPSCERVDIETMMECEKCGKEHCDNLQCRGYKDIPYYKIMIPKEEPKQETLEYDLLQHIKFCLECKNDSQAIRLIEKYGFEKQERMYSEEDLHNAFYNGWLYRGEDYQFPKAKKEWFEQFKKK